MSSSNAAPIPASRYKLPGFGLPVHSRPDNLFRNALDSVNLGEGDVQLPLTTLREFTMLHLMNQLTDKPNWHKKVFDETIALKWKAEILPAEDNDITEEMVDWCIDELRYKAKIFEETGAVSVYNGDVVKSDTAVSDSLKAALRQAVTALEDIPVREKDWHPGSDEKVLDLVHPSLFPLVYGRSRILLDSLVGLDDCIQRCGEGETIPVPSVKDANGQKVPDSYSKKFQWLPCEVDVYGGGAKITSYINNLHPQKHKNLYGVIEKIISCAIPLWNLTLTPLKIRPLMFHRIHYDSTYDHEYEEEHERDEHVQVVRQPEPGTFQPPSVPDHMREEYFDKTTNTLKPEKTVDLRRDYSQRGLQVIVKLANIQLTPEKPRYEGGSWHVEGQLNEHICATATYYYDSVNITGSRLGFRQQSSTDQASDVSYEQDEHDWLTAVFGCENEGPGVQDVGTVDTLEGRLLTWPNILQHQVQPFELADSSEPGHRKILALFLVDPNIRIISTANVPCQQRHWWSEHIQRGSGGISDLPVELQDHVFGQVEDFPLSLKEAKELRLELMEERKNFVVRHDEEFKQHQFSLCEH